MLLDALSWAAAASERPAMPTTARPIAADLRVVERAEVMGSPAGDEVRAGGGSRSARADTVTEERPGSVLG
ncbi:hypothetical protein CXY01_38560 [Cellulomonas xylanilytica]|uniref:Uncharacterized protein n=1 Tax=Cellulomonas xylanilytica TaxID=233583 RepID=A0A510V9B8_9CELL|nr:hypothetical protein CXY01_38560 [Cellulomonas xylanilytica]